MARPVVSAAAERAYASLPAYQKDEGDDSGWVMLHLCEAAVRTAQKATDVLRHDETGSGWRRMLDPDRCPAWALDWLRQYIGQDRFPPDFTEQQKRDTIRDAPRLRRGTAPMIRAAAGAFLTGTKTVIFVQRHGGSRRYTTAVRADEAPDQQRVVDELTIQKPATFIWSHFFVGSGGWGDVEATHLDWAEVEADFAGWDEVLVDPTQT